MRELSYISHRTVVRWFGPAVTLPRAVICALCALMNGILLLLPLRHFSSLSDWLTLLVAFPLFYVGLFGTASVVVLYGIGWFLAIVVKSFYTTHQTSLGGVEREYVETAIEEWTINAFLIVGEVLLVFAKARGVLWGT